MHMTRTTTLCCGILLGLLAVLGYLPAAARAGDQATVANAKARLKAAQKVYKGILERHKESPKAEPLNLEKLHRWSRRWMDAQSDLSAAKKNWLAAIKAHLARMQGLEKTVKEILKGGAASELAPYQAAQAEYYRLEAEQWLARAKQAKEK
jgi:hypothetical protein